MRKLLWVALLMGTILLMGAIVPAQEKSPQFTFPGMVGMGSMMGMGMMGKGGQMSQMRQMGSMMPMMQGMSEMREACTQMMGNPSHASQEGNR